MGLYFLSVIQYFFQTIFSVKLKTELVFRIATTTKTAVVDAMAVFRTYFKQNGVNTPTKCTDMKHSYYLSVSEY